MRRTPLRWATTGLGLLLLVTLVALAMRFMEPSTVHAAPEAVANLTVTNLNDSGAGSLRQAIADATMGDTITFAVTGKIILTSGELVVSKDLTLVGPGAGSLIISGNLASRVIHNSAHLTISGLTIADGLAFLGNGGGLLNEGTGNLVLTNTAVTNGRAQQGGGAYNSAGGSIQVINSTFSANLTELFEAGADASGAGLYNAGPGGTATISGSTFSGNSVHDNGSALFNAASASVANSTFSLNQAVGSGAVYNDKSSSLQLNNVTITVNTGKKDATGLFSAGGSVTLANSIIADNHTIGNTALPDCGGALTSGGYNLVGNATGCGMTAATGDLLGTNIVPVDAKLGPLTNNGGPTSTHTLLAGSPAIDAGSPAVPGTGAGACPAVDQRGVPRPQDGNGFGGARCDIGAVEIGGSVVRFRIFLPVIARP